ncbi:unnamed protein product [Leptosia nina]|uniref:Transcription elongation regulator 1 n=1 Tax=Leptosia nina TaxID=320188 RepID=A0AAV1K5N6_9NEOP
MEEEYSMDTQDSVASDTNRNDGNDSDTVKSDYEYGYEDFEDEEGFRGSQRGRGNFRGRGGRGMPPPGWMNGPPPMRFRGRGYGPGGPPMRGRGFFRGRGGPRFGPNGGPNFDNNWGPMGPPPPGMMGPPPFGPPPPGMMPPGGPMGPPPNMMGQPPPFGPPGMPPNMPPPEIWVETKSDEGKSYYYHQRTRETTWTRPQEGPTCKVITQAEMEAMVASGINPQTMGMNNPMGGPPMGGPPMGMMPNGMMGGMMPPGMGPQGGAPAPNSVPPFMSHPPPWVKEGNNQMKPEQAEQPGMEMDDLPPGETAQSSQQMMANVAPVTTSSNAPMGANMASGPPMNAGPMGAPNMGPGLPMGAGPPGGTWGPWGWGPPPMVAQPGFPGPSPDNGAGPPMGVQLAHVPGDEDSPILLDGSTPPPSKREPTVIPRELEAAAAEWTTHMSPDGRAYYHHAGRAESVWIKPEPLQRLEELRAKIAFEKGESLDKKKEPIILDGVIDVDEHEEALAAAEANAAAEKERAERERLDREKAEREREEREKAEKEKAEKEKAKPDKTRPVTSTPITGTPWCVVWTGDGRVFFYNPTARLSVWERPAQLLGRKDVDTAVAQPPHLLEQQQQQPRKETTTTPAASAKNANGELKRNIDSDTDSDSEGAKRAKQQVEVIGVTTKKAIDANADAAVEAEMIAARKRVVLPFEQRVTAFLQLLRESDVSAFSPWEKELHKIVFDDRYLLLESKERRQVFNKYVRDRAEEERKEKRNKLLAKKNAFKTLMEEAKLHSKSSFTEFSTKYCRDERFRGIEKLRERETYFNEHIAELRKKEKEEKEKRREQAKQDFIQLLKDKNADRHSRWVEVKKKIDLDVRYKAVESSSLREDYFREFCKALKDERKKEKDGKEKERDRSSRKDKKEKDRDKDKEKESKKEKKKDKSEKSDPPTEDEKKQPTPPPDQWAEILGIPGEEDSKSDPSSKSYKPSENSETSSENQVSPKVLRSSKKGTPTSEKSPLKIADSPAPQEAETRLQIAGN